MFQAIKTFLLLAVTTQVQAASFTSWPDDICRSVATHSDQVLEPYDCFALDSPIAAGSVKGSGLQDTNSAGGDRIELYADQNCEYYVSSVKHSNFCMIVQYRSLRYLPPLPKNETDATELVMSEEDIARDAEQRRADEELEATLKKIQREEEMGGAPGKGMDAVSRSRQDL